jgi:hypothetical protein
MPRSTPTALEAAQKRRQEAVRRVHVLRSQIGRLQAEGTSVNDAGSAELYQAGREGREPQGIAELAARSAEIKDELTALGRRLDGAEAAVQDAGNAISDAMFRDMPRLCDAQIEEASRLQHERAELEARAADLASREQAHRSAWLTLCKAIPGMPEPLFESGALLPTILPTDPQYGFAHYVESPDMPAWFVQLIHESRRYAERGVISA